MMLLAVNGSLMRGLELNRNLLEAGAKFVREDRTASIYRLWSIDDRYPGMIRAGDSEGAAIELEIWEMSETGLVQILNQEPAGLTIGRVLLESGDQILGILAEPYLIEGRFEITSYGGWRSYLVALAA
jgi:hypothetical protein